MKLLNDDDVRTMLSIFSQYSTRGPIELDGSSVRSVEEIRKGLIRPKNYEEIRAFLDAPYDEINLAGPWWCCFYYVFYVVFYYVFYVVFIMCLLYVVELSCFVMF